MEKRELRIGDVIQIRPDIDEIFGGALMIVTEPKSFGAQGAVHGLGKGLAYYRCEFKDMEYVGKAHWEIKGTPEDE